MSEKRIVLFGASTMAGFWDPRGGWFSRLREEVDRYSLENQHNSYQLYNCSISGDTSEGLRKRIRVELEARIEESKETVALICIGGNDALYYREREENQIDLGGFESNFRDILEIARDLSDEVFVISGTSFDWEKTDPLEWDRKKAYREKDIRKYSERKREICEDEGVEFFDLRSILHERVDDWGAMLEDGVHPNSEGHKVMKDILKEKLQNVGVIEESI